MADARSILLVADDVALRETLASLLQREGYVIATAASADEAVERLRDRDFDVVLSDVRVAGLAFAVERRMTVRDLEDRYIESVLRFTGGNKVRAARILGINRRTLYRRSEHKNAAARAARKEATT